MANVDLMFCFVELLLLQVIIKKIKKFKKEVGITIKSKETRITK